MCKSKEEQESVMIEVQRYRKKPISVEAVQWAGKTSWKDLEKFANYLVRSEGKVSSHQGPFFVYDRLHDTWIEFTFDDWIIKGIHGEFYPIKNDVFQECYQEEGTTYHGLEIKG
jgi:hypothetical protein